MPLLVSEYRHFRRFFNTYFQPFKSLYCVVIIIIPYCVIKTATSTTNIIFIALIPHSKARALSVSIKTNKRFQTIPDIDLSVIKLFKFNCNLFSYDSEQINVIFVKLELTIFLSQPKFFFSKVHGAQNLQVCSCKEKR